MKKFASNQMVGFDNTELSKNGIPLVDNFWLKLLYQSIKGSVVQQIWTLEKKSGLSGSNLGP